MSSTLIDIIFSKFPITRFGVVFLLMAITANAEYATPMRPKNSGFLADGHVVYRVAASKSSTAANFTVAGWAFDTVTGNYKAIIKSILTSYGFPNGNFKKYSGWNPGEQLYDFAGAGFESLCNAIVYAVGGYVVACRSMKSNGKYNIYLVKVDDNGNRISEFGTDGIVDTGLGGVATEHALVRGIAYNPDVNGSNNGVVVIGGARGYYSAPGFNPFIKVYDQKTGAAYSSLVTDSSLQGTVVAVAYDSSSHSYYVATTETKNTNHFYVNKYSHDGGDPTQINKDTTHSWGNAIDFTAAISTGAAHSIPSTITVSGTNVIVGGGNKIDKSTPPWRCAVASLKVADGTLNTSFGRVPLSGGTDNTGISLFSHETSPTRDCIINNVMVTSGSNLFLSGTAYTSASNYDYLLARLDSSGALIASFGNGDVAGTETVFTGPVDDVLNATTLLGSGTAVATCGRSADGDGYNGGDCQYVDVATGAVARSLQSLSVTASLAGVSSGSTASTTVVATFEGGSTATIPSSSFNWVSSNTSNLSVDESGNVLGLSGSGVVGSSNISAAIAGVSMAITLSNPGFVKMLTAKSPGSFKSLTNNSSAVDSSGNSYYAGTFNDGGILNGKATKSNPGGYILKIDASGVLVWSDVIGPTAQYRLAHAMGVAVDSSGNAYVVGDTTGSLNGESQVGSVDLYLVKYSSSGSVLWTRQAGVTAEQSYANRVSLDSSGNIFVAGYTTGGLNGNSQTGTNDAFVLKYNSTGTLQWANQYGTSGQSSYANGVSVDSSGNVFIAGYTTGGLNGNSQTGAKDAFVGKLNNSGTLQWLFQMGASGKESIAGGVAVDTSGNAYLAGYTTGGLNGNSQIGSRDFFISKHNGGSGSIAWLNQVGQSSKIVSGMGIALDSSNNVYLVGHGNASLSGNTLSSATDIIIAKYNESGSLSWLKQLGNQWYGFVNGFGVAVDGTGNSYLAGNTTTSLNGGTQYGMIDAVAAKYNGSGSLQWVRQVGSDVQRAQATGVHADCSGSTVVVGGTTGSLTDGGWVEGGSNYFITKHNDSGTRQWVKQIGSPQRSSDTIANAVARNASGDSYVAGSTTGPLNGNSLLGTRDLFLSRHNGSGNLVWVTQVGVTAGTSQALGVAVDSSENIYVAGSTTKGLNGNSQTGSTDLVLAKFNASGTLIWLTQLGASSGTSIATGVSLDASGNIYISGYTNVGLNGKSQTGSIDSFIAKYDASGTLIWLSQLGSSGGYAGETKGMSIATDSSGNSYITGHTSASGLNGNTQTASYDFYLAKFNASGTLSWVTQKGRLHLWSYAYGVSIDSSGNAYVTGQSVANWNAGAGDAGNYQLFVTKYNSSGVSQWISSLPYSLNSTGGSAISANTCSGDSYAVGAADSNVDGNKVIGTSQILMVKYNTSGTRQ